MSLMLSDNLAPQPMTDVFTEDTNIDRRKCHRTVPMKVLALGVGRTGTACEYIPHSTIHTGSARKLNLCKLTNTPISSAQGL